MDRIEMDRLEKTVDFYDADGRLVLKATLGIHATDLVTERQFDFVNKLLWDFPDLVEKRIIADGE